MRPLTRLTVISAALFMSLAASGVVRQSPSAAQTRKRASFFCSYGEENRGAELCSLLQRDTFGSNQHAERVVDLILQPVGLRRNFVLVPCPHIDNAAAVTYEDGIRYIVYDNSFMEAIDRGASTNWASVSILAHEIGHHLQGHTLRAVSLQQRRENELEADEFSGFAMFKLGRSLAEAQAAMNNFPDVADEERSTHPKKSRRLAAIRKGYESAQSQEPRRTTGAEGNLVISAPQGGASVGIDVRVEGRGAIPGMNLYLVVMSQTDRGYWIQDPVSVSSDGSWVGRAAFGTYRHGINHNWSIRAMATREVLATGQMFRFPADARLSEQVVVTRVR